MTSAQDASRGSGRITGSDQPRDALTRAYGSICAAACGSARPSVSRKKERYGARAGSCTKAAVCPNSLRSCRIEGVAKFAYLCIELYVNNGRSDPAFSIVIRIGGRAYRRVCACQFIERQQLVCTQIVQFGRHGHVCVYSVSGLVERKWSLVCSGPGEGAPAGMGAVRWRGLRRALRCKGVRKGVRRQRRALLSTRAQIVVRVRGLVSCALSS